MGGWGPLELVGQNGHLGHCIDEYSMSLDPKKVEAISGISPPESIVELKSLLGMVQC